MALSNALLSELVKVTAPPATNDKTTEILYGTVKITNNQVHVVLDGSESPTPANTTINVSDGERVSVVFKNHTALITGNATSKAARIKDVNESVNSIVLRVTVDGKVSTEIEMGDNNMITLTGDVMAQYINTDQLFARLITLTGALLVQLQDGTALGKLGGLTGSTGSEETTGIGMQNSDSTCEIITTNAGSRMSAGDYEITVTKLGTAAVKGNGSSVVCNRNGNVYITGPLYHRNSESDSWTKM